MRSFSAWPNTGGVSTSLAAYSQRPLRLDHCGCSSDGRASCGRGYSGSALSGDTSAVHGVASGGTLPLHVAALALMDGGASPGSLPQAVFGFGPIVSTSVALLAMSAWLNEGLFQGLPLSVADWIYGLAPVLSRATI